MAGGTFKVQNKVRPGAYINFKAKPAPLSSLGTRGVVTIPLEMSWGDGVVEVNSTDLLDGKSIPKIGYSAFDPEAQVFREALKGAHKGLFYRLDSGGTHASMGFGDLTATAKYAGVVGNDISVEIEASGAGSIVRTYYKGQLQDEQYAEKLGEVKSNDWAIFDADTFGDDPLSPAVNTKLEGGTDGTVDVSTAYANYLNAVKTLKWDTMGVMSDSSTVHGAVIAYIEEMRENVGRKVQAVLLGADADYEGIIVSKCGYTTDEETISPSVFIAYVAGLTAGSDVDSSNTYHVIRGAKSIVYPNGIPYDDEDIEDALKRGELVLSTRLDGVIVIEQDINSLHTFTSDKNYTFSKNRVIRTLDEINNSINILFGRSYIGRQNNNDDGRAILKADIASYLLQLQGINAIQNFDAKDDIEIAQGTAIDAVVVNLAIQPVDSMEKLYVTVTVG